MEKSKATQLVGDTTSNSNPDQLDSSVLFHYLVLGEGNGTHSSTLAWKIPWMEEPVRL